MPVVPTITVSRRWIASSNAEWGVEVRHGRRRLGWVRGGSLRMALARAAEHVDPAVGGRIVIQPDTTAEQAWKAHEAFFGS